MVDPTEQSAPAVMRHPGAWSKEDKSLSDLDATTPTKVCTKCGRENPATLEYFHARKRGKYGLHNWCKQCVAEYTRVYRAEHRDEVAAYRAGHREEAAAYAAAYYAEHREDLAAYGVAYSAAYYAAHRDERAAYHAAYRAEHREGKAAYRAEHRDEAAAYDRNRRARKLGNGGTHTADDVKAQYARQRGTCYWCHVKVGDTYHVDHVMPVILGGSNGPENLVISCPTCNLSKGAKHPQNFAGRLL